MGFARHQLTAGRVFIFCRYSFLLYFYLGSGPVYFKKEKGKRVKEYTLLAFICVVVTLWLDGFSRLYILKRKEFYFFLAVIIFFKFLVNGYLTGAGVVIYNPRFYLGVRIGSIPLEDFFFGFGMVSMTIIFWEYFKKRF